MIRDRSIPGQTIALTGAQGLMGRILLPKLASAGVDVRALTRSALPAGENSIPIPGDLLDAPSVEKLVQGAASLVHLAGIAHTDLRSAAEREAARAVNVEAAVALFAEARKSGVQRAIYMSSAYVYKGQQGLDLREDSPVGEGSFYGALKLEAETRIRALERPGFEVVILRPCLTYGPGARYNLYALMNAIERGHYVHPAGADPLRSFASVGTVTATVLHLLQLDVVSGTFNLADRTPQLLSEWVNQIAAILHARTPRSIPYPLLLPVAALGTVARGIGLPTPVTLESLRKLTTPFTLNTNALAATGFQWPADFAEYQRSMVESFLQAHPS